MPKFSLIVIFQTLQIDQPAAFDISTKFRSLSLDFDEDSDLVDRALETDTFMPASFKTFSTHLAIAVDVAP